MLWLAVLLLVLAGVYVAIERGESGWDRVLRWMVIIGALLMAFAVGGGVFG